MADAAVVDLMLSITDNQVSHSAVAQLSQCSDGCQQ